MNHCSISGAFAGSLRAIPTGISHCQMIMYRVDSNRFIRNQSLANMADNTGSPKCHLLFGGINDFQPTQALLEPWRISTLGPLGWMMISQLFRDLALFRHLQSLYIRIWFVSKILLAPIFAELVLYKKNYMYQWPNRLIMAFYAAVHSFFLYDMTVKSFIPHGQNSLLNRN